MKKFPSNPCMATESIIPFADPLTCLNLTENKEEKYLI